MNSHLPDFAHPNKQIPAWFEEIVKKAASKKPEDRFQDASEFLLAIAEHAEETASNVTRLMRLSGVNDTSCESVYRMQSVHAENNEVQSPEIEAGANQKAGTGKRIAQWAGGAVLLVGLGIGATKFTQTDVPAEVPNIALERIAELEKVAAEAKAEKKAKEDKEKLTLALKSELNSYAAAIPMDMMVLPEERKPKKKPEAKKPTVANTGQAAPVTNNEPRVQVASVSTRTRAPKGKDLLGVARKAYSGDMKPIGSGGRARTLTLDIAFSGSNISGTATIKGLGSFDVVGKKTTRGYDMTLVGRAIEVVLNGAERKETIRGTYRIPKQNKNGSWKASLLR